MLFTAADVEALAAKVVHRVITFALELVRLRWATVANSACKKSEWCVGGDIKPTWHMIVMPTGTINERNRAALRFICQFIMVPPFEFESVIMSHLKVQASVT